MKVKMIRSLAGPDVSYVPGREYDLDEAFAKALCADGRAEAVEAPKPKTTPKRERKTKRPPEPNVETR